MWHAHWYYCDLKTFEIIWESSHKLGMDISDVQRMVYNPFIMAKQEILPCNEHNKMIVKITQSVADAMKLYLNCKEVNELKE